jgi:pimeloyl-ACP methyl ester carboxylesterase
MRRIFLGTAAVAGLTLAAAVGGCGHRAASGPAAAPGSASAPAEGYAPVENGRLYYETRGAGPAVVLIHGGNMDRRIWDDQIPALAERYRVVRYDVRGFGRSSDPASPYASEEDLRRLMDHLALDRATLIGLSLGGRIAIDFALAHPQSVRALVLAGPGLSGFDWSDDLSGRRERLRKAIEAKDDDAVIDWWLTSDYMKPAMANEALAPKVRAIVKENLHSWYREAPETELSPPAAGRLPEIRVPTLVVVGALDIPDIQRIVDTIAADVPGAEKKVIEGAGHMVNMERPAEFNRLLLDFLARH